MDRDTKLKLVSVKEAAQLIDKLTEYMIRKMIRTGELEPIKIGRKIYIVEDDIYRAIFWNDTDK